MAIQRFGDGRDWFFDAQFGMFIHWGIYAAAGFHEQEQWRKPVSRKKYDEYRTQFNPVKFDPDAWLSLVEDAGMNYICVTAKHHDGFCLWDTKETSFNIMNTPYKRDIIAMLADACKRRNIKLCLYYSCVDWHHPNYPNQGRHHEIPVQEGDEPDMAKYLSFVSAQLRELCTNYGEIGAIFWDMNVPQVKDYGINAMIRKLQPNAVINDRGYDEGDYGTPERDYQSDKLAQTRAFDKPTEACQSVGMESWGYRREENYYSSKYLTQSIARIFAMGGNYLLNVGPTAEGVITPESVSLLKKIGTWYRAVHEAFDNTEPASHLILNKDIMLTRKENTLYAHLYQDPKGSAVMLEPLSILPKRVTLLNDGRELIAVRNQGVRLWTQEMEYVKIRGIPVEEYTDTVMVLKLDFDHLPADLGAGKKLDHIA